MHRQTRCGSARQPTRSCSNSEACHRPWAAAQHTSARAAHAVPGSRGRACAPHHHPAAPQIPCVTTCTHVSLTRLTGSCTLLKRAHCRPCRNRASQGCLPQLDFGARTPKKPFGNLVRRAPVHVDVIYCMQYVPSLQHDSMPTNQGTCILLRSRSWTRRGDAACAWKRGQTAQRSESDCPELHAR